MAAHGRYSSPEYSKRRFCPSSLSRTTITPSIGSSTHGAFVVSRLGQIAVLTFTNSSCGASRIFRNLCAAFPVLIRNLVCPRKRNQIFLNWQRQAPYHPWKKRSRPSSFERSSGSEISCSKKPFKVRPRAIFLDYQL